MPVISSITWETYGANGANKNKYLAENDTEAANVYASLNDLLYSLENLQGIDEILKDDQTCIINGVAPLKQLSSNLQTDINSFLSSNNVVNLARVFKTEATDHIGSEKEQTLFKVEEQYKKAYIKPLEDAIESYNMKPRHAKYNEDKKDYDIKYYSAKLNYSMESAPSISYNFASGNTYPPSSVLGSAITGKLELARKFYNEYVVPAKKLKNKKYNSFNLSPLQQTKKNIKFITNTILNIDTQLLGGAAEAAETYVIDGFGTLIAKAYNAAGKTEKRDRIADFIEKDHVQDFLKDQYKNNKVLKTLDKNSARFFRSYGKGAKYVRYAGNFAGIVGMAWAGGAAVGSVAGALGAGATTTSALKFGSDIAVFAGHGLGEGMEHRLQIGQSFDDAFKGAEKQAAFEGATAAGIGLGFNLAGKVIPKVAGKVAPELAGKVFKESPEVYKAYEMAEKNLSNAGREFAEAQIKYQQGALTKEEAEKVVSKMKEAVTDYNKASNDLANYKLERDVVTVDEAPKGQSFKEAFKNVKEDFKTKGQNIKENATTKAQNVKESTQTIKETTTEKIQQSKPVQKYNEAKAKYYDKKADIAAKKGSKDIDLNDLESKGNQKIYKARSEEMEYRAKADELRGKTETPTDGTTLGKVGEEVTTKSEAGLVKPGEDGGKALVTSEEKAVATGAEKAGAEKGLVVTETAGKEMGESLATNEGKGFILAGEDAAKAGDKMVPYEKPVETVAPYEKPNETIGIYEKPAEGLEPIKKPEPVPELKVPKKPTATFTAVHLGVPIVHDPVNKLESITPPPMPTANGNPSGGGAPTGGGGGGYTSYPSSPGGTVATGGSSGSTPTTPSTPAPAPTPIVNPDPVPTPSNPIPKSTTSPDQVIENVTVPNTGLDKNISFADIAVPIGLGAATIGSGAAVAKGIKDYKEEKEDKDKKDKKDDREEKE